MNEPEQGQQILAEEIQALLPHRYPFLLVDRVLDYRLEPDRWLRAVKNVTLNEPHFPGHFPSHPVMPGVLVIEAMAQAAGVLTQLVRRDSGDEDDELFYLVKIDKARFSRVITPGDQLVMDVRLHRAIRNMGHYSAEARVDGEKAAVADFLCAKRRPQ